MQPVCVLAADDRPDHAFAEEVLKAEGIYFYSVSRVNEREFDLWKRSPVLLLLSGEYDQEVSDFLFDYLRNGGAVIACCPAGPFLDRLGLTLGEVLTDARVHVLENAGLPTSPEDLLCPGATSRQLSGSGEVLATLRSEAGSLLGPGLLRLNIGRGTLFYFAYDPIAAVIRLRHGTGEFDQRPEMAGLRGPRHINGFVGLAEKYSKTVPLADLHQDLLREAIFQALSDWGPLPRLWYFPEAAKALFFIKSDGCGEEGIDQEIALAERHDAKVTFYRRPRSAYPGALIREWRDRGHGMSIEVDINQITYRQTTAGLGPQGFEAIRSLLGEYAREFREDCGFEAQSICIHSCQWTGASMARLLMERGWWLPTHFISHDPRMTRESFGPYTIGSTLPMRYYDEEVGVMDLFMQPAQYDESQAVGPRLGAEEAVARGQAQLIGFTQEEYSEQLERFMRESVEQYHGVHIANFHPVYLDPAHPRTSYQSFQDVLDAARRLGIPRWELEGWCAFVRGRDALRISRIQREGSRTTLQITTALDVEGLTLLIPGASPSLRVYLDARELRVEEGTFEGKRQRYVIVSLNAGRTALLDLVDGT